jgi:hypothetical protein
MFWDWLTTSILTLLEVCYALNSANIEGRRMACSGMLRRVALVRTDFSEERMASIIRVKESVN